MSAVALSERILSLRAAAIAIYDKGFAVGKKQEELNEDIEPLKKMMDKVIDHGASNDLPGCVMAIQRLETLARAHEADAQFLLEKSANSRFHSEVIKKRIIEKMKTEGVTEKRAGDFVLVLVKQGEREILTVR